MTMASCAYLARTGAIQALEGAVFFVQQLPPPWRLIKLMVSCTWPYCITDIADTWLQWSVVFRPTPSTPTVAT